MLAHEALKVALVLGFVIYILKVIYAKLLTFP